MTHDPNALTFSSLSVRISNKLVPVIKEKKMKSVHTFDLEFIRPQAIRNGGSRAMANENNFPILKGMALYSLRLNSGGIREPHWHPNAA